MGDSLASNYGAETAVQTIPWNSLASLVGFIPHLSIPTRAEGTSITSLFAAKALCHGSL